MSDQGMAMSSDQGDLIRQLAELRAENAAFKAKAAARARSSVSFKVSEKGAVSIYGMGKWPITLYLSQFERLNAAWEDLQAFVSDNKHLLATKD